MADPLVGLLLLSPGLAAAIYGLTLVSKHGGFDDARVLSWLAAGLALIAGFVVWSLRPANSAPLIDLRLLSRKSFAGGALVLFFLGTVMYGVSLVAPLYFQQARGWTALHAGLLNLPMGVGTAIALIAAGRLTDKMGPRVVALTGAALGVLGVTALPALLLPNSPAPLSDEEMALAVAGGATGEEER